MGGECYTNPSKLFPVTLSVQIAVFRPCPGCEIQCSSVSFENVSASVDRHRKLTVGLITALVACVSLNENWEWPMPGCACKGKTRKLPNLPSISALSWPYMHVICCLQRVDTEVKPQACNICSVILIYHYYLSPPYHHFWLLQGHWYHFPFSCSQICGIVLTINSNTFILGCLQFLAVRSVFFCSGTCCVIRR